MRFSPVIALFAVAVAALGLAAAPPTAPTPSASPRSAAEPVLEHCLVSVLKEAKVPAREGGVLIDLLVREGDSIKAGDVIAKIDASQPQFERRKAKAEHDQAVAKASSDVDVRSGLGARGGGGV